MRDLNDKELKLLGISLYECEGTKRRRVKGRKSDYHYAIEFTNSNPVVIRLFLLFLRRILGVKQDGIRLELFIYDDLKVNELEKFWSKITRIPRRQFNKTIVLKQKNERYKPNPRGTCKIRYYDVGKFLKLEKMINDFFS